MTWHAYEENIWQKTVNSVHILCIMKMRSFNRMLSSESNRKGDVAHWVMQCVSLSEDSGSHPVGGDLIGDRIPDIYITIHNSKSTVMK